MQASKRKLYFYCRFPFLNTPVPFVFVQHRQTTERLLSAGCETLIFYLIARFCQSDHIDFNIKLRLINNQFKVVACVTSKTKLCSLADCVKKPVSSSLCILVCVCLHENITCECQLRCADAHLMMDCVQGRARDAAVCMCILITAPPPPCWDT